jgi:hypothetical protein
MRHGFCGIDPPVTGKDSFFMILFFYEHSICRWREQEEKKWGGGERRKERNGENEKHSTVLSGAEVKLGSRELNQPQEQLHLQ